MSWLEQYRLCSGRICDPATILSRQDQERVLASLSFMHIDGATLQSLRSLVSGERLGAQTNKLSSSAFLSELRFLLRSGKLHLHSRPKTYHRTSSYAAQPEVTKAEPQKKAPAGIAQVNWDTWVAIKLVDEDKQPVAGIKYRITLPDKSVKEGTLDKEGKARVDSFKPGQCKICFPDLDAHDWHPL